MNNISILLVEDEDPKAEHIKRFLKNLTNTYIKVARSVHSAFDAIEDFPPDLIILDMSLPTFDIGERENGGRPQVLGGVEVIRHMMFLEIAIPTIVITGYEAFPREIGKPIDLSQMKSDLYHEFPDIVQGVIHYNSTYEEWKAELNNILQKMKLI